MARPRQYDPEQALDSALTLFWEQGYDATSLDELIQRMGVSRSTFYAAFESKHALFLKALRHYSNSFVSSVFGPVERPEADLHDIRRYFENLVTFAETKGLPGLGCLMANSMAELVFRDPEVEEVVRGHFTRQRTGFKRALANSVATGLLPENFQVAEQAHFLAVSVQGLSIYARLCQDPKELRTYVQQLCSFPVPARDRDDKAAGASRRRRRPKSQS